MTMHRRSNMSVDNLARGQRTMLSTAEPGTPARGERMSQGEPTPQGQQPIKPHGVHLNPAVRLSKRWGPPLAAFGGWLRAIAINECRVWHRSRWSGAINLESVSELRSSEPTAQHSLEQAESERTAIDLLDLLSDPVAVVARLHYVDDLSAPEIASVLGVPVSTVEGRLYRARARFRSAIGESSADSEMKKLILKLITLHEGAVKMDAIRIEIGCDLVPLVKMSAPNLIGEIANLRSSLESEAELLLPAVRIRDSIELGPTQFRILVNGTEVASSEAKGESAIHEVLNALRHGAVAHRDELLPR